MAPVLVREREALFLDELLLEGGFFLLDELGVVHLVKGAFLASHLQHDIVAVTLHLDLDLAGGDLGNGRAIRLGRRLGLGP